MRDTMKTSSELERVLWGLRLAHNTVKPHNTHSDTLCCNYCWVSWSNWTIQSWINDFLGSQTRSLSLIETFIHCPTSVSHFDNFCTFLKCGFYPVHIKGRLFYMCQIKISLFNVVNVTNYQKVIRFSHFSDYDWNHHKWNGVSVYTDK